MKKGILILMLSLSLISQASSQTLESGPIIGFGIGLGFSTHAGSYQIDEVVRIREYPGFRAYNLEARLGWAITPKLQIYGVSRLSPSNSTISPYRALYSGGVVSYAFGEYLPLYAVAGAGRNSAKVNNGLKAGTGTLINLGVGKQLSEKFFIEVNSHFGAMSHPGEVKPDPFDDRELNFYIMLSYHII